MIGVVILIGIVTSLAALFLIVYHEGKESGLREGRAQLAEYVLERREN